MFTTNPNFFQTETVSINLKYKVRSVILLLLLRWHYSPMRTFASLMFFSQSALFLTSFQLLILHLLISVFTQLYYLFFGLWHLTTYTRALVFFLLEVNGRSADQEIHRLLFYVRVHSRVHNSPLSVRIHSQINPNDIKTPIPLRSILALPCHLRVCLVSSCYRPDWRVTLTFWHSQPVSCLTSSGSLHRGMIGKGHAAQFWKQGIQKAYPILGGYTSFVLKHNKKYIYTSYLYEL